MQSTSKQLALKNMQNRKGSANSKTIQKQYTVSRSHVNIDEPIRESDFEQNKEIGNRNKSVEPEKK